MWVRELRSMYEIFSWDGLGSVHCDCGDDG